MLPALLWLLAAALAAVVASVRFQLLILSRFPDFGWLAATGGLLLAGLALMLAVVVVGTFRSLRRTGLVVLAGPTLAVGLGVAALLRVPAAATHDPGVAAAWSRLHPTLRVAVWVTSLFERGLVLTAVGPEGTGHVSADQGPEVGPAEPSPAPGWPAGGLPAEAPLDAPAGGAAPAPPAAEARGPARWPPPEEPPEGAELVPVPAWSPADSLAAAEAPDTGGYARSARLCLRSGGPLRFWLLEGVLLVMGLDVRQPLPAAADALPCLRVGLPNPPR